MTVIIPTIIQDNVQMNIMDRFELRACYVFSEQYYQLDESG